MPTKRKVKRKRKTNKVKLDHETMLKVNRLIRHYRMSLRDAYDEGFKTGYEIGSRRGAS